MIAIRHFPGTCVYRHGNYWKLLPVCCQDCDTTSVLCLFRHAVIHFRSVFSAFCSFLLMTFCCLCVFSDHVYKLDASDISKVNYTVSGKKEATVFQHNFDKFRHSFIIFFAQIILKLQRTKSSENLAQHCNIVTWR